MTSTTTVETLPVGGGGGGNGGNFPGYRNAGGNQMLAPSNAATPAPQQVIICKLYK